MTASPGREVDANLLRGAAPGSAQARTHAQDAGGQDLGNLVEPLGGSHEVRIKSVGRGCARSLGHTCYLPAPTGGCRIAPVACRARRRLRRLDAFWFYAILLGPPRQAPSAATEASKG